MRIRGIFSITVVCLLATVVHAQDGWRRAIVDPATVKLHGAYVSPQSGTSGVGGGQTKSMKTLSVQSVGSLSSGAGLDAADQVTPYVQSLADGLGHDPVRIYEWVKNNVDFVPYNGLKRGAHLTAMERSGNDFDTSALLVALLKASGYLDVSYRFGNVAIEAHRSDGVDAEHWLGADKSQITSLLAVAGCFYGSGYEIYYEPDYSVTYFPHVWVALSIGGVEYVLDPSFKLYKSYAPVAPSAYAYSSTAVMTAAAGTLSGVAGTTQSSVYTMTSTGKNSVRSTLNAYATALSNYALNTVPDQSGVALAGGKVIVPQLITSLPTSLPPCFAINDSLTWTQIPIDYAVQFSVSVGNISYSCYSAELQGQKLAVWFQGSAAQLWLDDTQLGGTETGFDANAKAAVTLGYTYNSNTSPSWLSQSSSPAPLTRTGCYVVTYGFDRTLGRLYDRLHRQSDYVAQNFDPQGRQLRTENLYIMALQYLNQLSELNAVAGGVAQSSIYMVQHAGIAGQTTSPFVDLPVNLTAAWPRTEKSADFFENLNKSSAYGMHLFLCCNYWLSMLEHATIEQTIPGAGVSTVKMLQRAVELGVPIYLIGNQSDYTVIKPLLQYYPGTYLSAAEVAKIEATMSAGGIVMLPKNSAMTYNSYHGTGYMLSNNAGTVTMGIAGGLAGGYSTITADSSLVNTFSFDSYIAPVSLTFTPSMQSLPTLADPVEMTTGAFYQSATDLALGESAPHGLSLSRMYSSGHRSADPVGLGKGWTHSYDIKINLRHPNDFDFQRASASDVAPFVVGFQTILDTFSETSFTAKTWTVPAIVASWLGDQLIDTRAVITLGERACEFTVLPDGTYAPPPGMAATLTKNASNGQFTLAYRKGSSILFYPINTALTSGKFISITDKNNSAATAYSLTATYLSSGLLNRVTDSYTRYLQFAYDGAGHLTSVTDSASPARSVSYGLETTAAGNAYTFTDAEGKKSWYYYDSKNRVYKVIDPMGRTTVTSVYDNWDHVIEQRTLGMENHFWSIGCVNGLARNRDPEGNTTWYYFDGRGRQFAEMNGKGEVSRVEFDGIDRVVKKTTPMGEVTSCTYNKNHELISVTNNAGNTRVITPASDDSVTVPRTEKNFEGNPTVTTYYSYHKPKDVTGPGGLKAEYQYDTRGRISKMRPAAFASGQWISYAYTLTSGYISRITATYPDATTEISNFNAQGDVIQTIDRCGKKSTITYNNRRQPIQMAQWTGSYTAASAVGGTPPVGSLVKTIGYDDNGDKSSETVDGKTVVYEHDALGNVIEVWGPDGVLQADNYYDERNLLTSSIDAYGFETSYVYDAAQRLDHVFDPLVRPTFYTYDADGRGHTVTSPRGYSSTDTYDAAGNKQTTTDAKSQVVTYGYDKDGRPKTITNRRNKTYTTIYDDVNRLKTSSTPLGKTTVSANNTRGLLDTATEPSNQKTSNTAYDNEGRVLTQVFKDAAGTVVATTTFTYYANGLPNTVTETPAAGAAHTTTRTYDDLNRLYSYSDGEGNTMGYRYDNSGNLSQLIYPDGKTVTYGYDVNNRLWHVTDWSNRVTTYTYDEGGRLSRIDRPNGTWRKMVYDAAGQLRQAEEHQIGASGALLWLQALRYDNVGKDQNFRFNDGEITWNYTFPAPQAFTLPADSATYDDDNQLLSWAPGGGSTITPVFDADGNMTSGPLPSGAVGSYTYDTRNRLIAAGSQTYRYNPEGHRVQVDATTYVVDPSSALSRVLVRNVGGTITRYVWGLGLIYEETGTSTKTYHANPQGSTVALTDDAGNVTDRIEYAPYGSVTYRTGTSDTPFLLHGSLGVMTDSSGLNYMRARYYNGRLMRFLNADPIGFAGGSNWYAFGNNNPISNVDPSGYCGQNSSNSYTSVAGSGMGSSWSLQDQAFSNSMGYAPENLNGAYYGQLSQLAAAAGDSALERSANLGLLGAVNDDPSTLARNLVVGLSSGMAPALERSLIQTAEKTVGETYFRTMSQAHYEQLLASGKLPATAETFISPSLTYASQYDGVTVQFTLRAGTTNSLMNIGVRNAGLGGETFESLPLVQKGWTSSNAFFKLEGDVINVGLGRGAALETFNNNILAFGLLK